MAMERRYKPLGQGLPGKANFKVPDLSDGNLIEWDATAGKWIISEILSTEQGGTLGGGQAVISDPTADDKTWLVLKNGSSGASGGGVLVHSSDGQLYLDNRRDSGGIHLRGWNASSVSHDMIIADPDGATGLYWNGVRTLSTKDGGVLVEGTEAGFTSVRSGAGGVSLGTTSGGSGILRQRDDAGANEGIHILLQKNSGVVLYYDDTKRLETVNLGAQLRGDGTNTRLQLLDSDETDLALFQHTTTDLILDNRVNSGVVEIRGKDSGGTTTTLASMDPDGAVELSYNGSVKVETVPSGICISDSGDAPRNTRADVQIEWRDITSSVVFATQDGNGRGHIYWNAVSGTQEYLVSSEEASWYSFGGANGHFFKTATGGTAGNSITWRDEFYINGGVQVGTPTGGYKGVGTLNAENGVYDNNSLLTDYVFDAELEGDVDTAKWDRTVPNKPIRRPVPGTDNGEGPEYEDLGEEVRVHEPARDFKGRQDDLDPKTFAAKWRRDRKLPAFVRKGRDPDGDLSVGEATQRLLETCEVQAVHIDKLLARIEALEEARNG